MIKGAALIFSLLMVFSSCTFDYTDGETVASTLPDIAMSNIEYTRVANGNPEIKLKAAQADRYDERQVMDMTTFSFEQFNTSSGEVDTTGQGDSATIDLNALNVNMSGNVNISADSEDMKIATSELDYQDADKTLKGKEGDTVNISRSDGTLVKGNGFTADVRSRSFDFASDVSGIWVQEDDEETQDSGTTETESINGEAE
jgi:LPS export ABC transporter protein LptC